MSLLDRFDTVTERSVLLQIFRDIENEPEEYDDVVDAMCLSLDLFRKFLTSEEYTTKLEPIVKRECPRRAIIQLSRCLTDLKNDDFRDVMTVMSWVNHVAEQSMAKVICDSLKMRETDISSVQLYRDFASACVNIPEKMSNCRGTATENSHLEYINMAISGFKWHLVKGIEKALLEAHDSQQPNLKTLAELMSALRNMDLDKSSILTRFMDWIERIDFDEKWKSIMPRIFLTPTILGIQVHEALLTSVFLSARNVNQLKRCLHTTEITGLLKRVVLIKLPFQRVLEPYTAKLLVRYLLETKEELAVGLLETALNVWSDSNYGKTTRHIQEKHLVRIILELLFHLKNRPYLPWNRFFLITSKGFLPRMEGTATCIQSAAFITEVFCKVAAEHSPNGQDLPEPPTLEDVDKGFLPDTLWPDEMRSIFEGGIGTLQLKINIMMDEHEPEPEQPQRVVANPLPKLKKKCMPRNHKQITRKVQLDSDDDGEEFPKYDVADTEKNLGNLEIGEQPKSTVPPPSYISDAFQMLLEKEKYEVFEAAFFHLPVLIRRRAVGFNQLAEQIVLRVVNLQNNFGTRNFAETVEDIASACISHRPEIVPSLIKTIIAPGQGDRIQQALFHYIHKAADEMGHLDEQHAEHLRDQVRRMETAQLQARDVIRPNWQKVVDARIAAKTRIITGKPRPPIGTVNRLGQACNYMFYPLLVLPRGANARLLREQSDLLALIIMVASMVFMRSGISPSITSMTNELLAYIIPHRFSENSKVRTAVLAAHLNIIARLPQGLLTAFYATHIRKDWMEYAHVVLTSATVTEIETDMAQQLHSILASQFDQENI